MTVYKIGGSLLDSPYLTDIVRQLNSLRMPSPALFVVGGGPAADAVRRWDQQHDLGDNRSHDLALKSLDLSRFLLCALVPILRPVRNVAQIRMAAAENVPAILCADCFLKSAEAQGHSPLERSWRVTSDSIAAWTARIIGASELILVKSTNLPADCPLETARQLGLVDESFPELARDLLSLSWINARNQPIVVQPWPRS
jgi:aspartokinase-like uncharacterized kinase